MKTRERFQRVLNFERPDRLPIVEWATWWDLTVKRWEGEGMPRGLSDIERQEYFGLDLLVQEWVSPRTAAPGPMCAAGPSRAATPSARAGNGSISALNQP